MWRQVHSRRRMVQPSLTVFKFLDWRRLRYVQSNQHKPGGCAPLIRYQPSQQALTGCQSLAAAGLFFVLIIAKCPPPTSFTCTVLDPPPCQAKRKKWRPLLGSAIPTSSGGARNYHHRHARRWTWCSQDCPHGMEAKTFNLWRSSARRWVVFMRPG